MSERPEFDAREVFVESYVPGWLAARRYGISARMVAEATQRREAGDWRGACAAARVDVHLDLADVRDRHGEEVAARLEDDLRHLAPDLVRWHLPRRSRGGSGLIRPDLPIPLARYTDEATLYARTPMQGEGPQRFDLRLGRSRKPFELTHDWTDARYLWDARETHRLLARLGGEGAERVPFFGRDGRPHGKAPAGDGPVELAEQIMLLQDAGAIAEAWGLGGLAVEFDPPDSSYYRPNGDRTFPATLAARVDTLAPVAWAALAGPSAPTSLVLLPAGGWSASAVVLSLDDDMLTGRRINRYDARGRSCLPGPYWQRFPDLELLRTGHLTPEQVHPLVRAAMFPDQPDPGFHPRTPQVGAPIVPVRCRGTWHRVGWRDGRVDALDHTPEEAQRERVMRSLGGEVPACFTVTETWQGAVKRRLPRTLRQLRAHALATLAHGDTDAFLRVLDLGVDPAGIRDRWDRNPLHHIAKVDGVAVLARLLDAGLDLNATDGKGRTPLLNALYDGAPARLIHALLDAGADPLATDAMDDTALHLLRTPDGAELVARLVAAGVDLEARDTYGRTPLMTQILINAPASALRATLDAGADPTAEEEYSEQTIAEIIDNEGREDLDFLVAAAQSNAVEDGSAQDAGE